jgi:hypothetical protein
MNAPYVRLVVTLALGALAMFFVLHATIGAPGSREMDLGMACLALMLAAPMGVLILLIMPHFFRRLGANLALYAAFALIFLGAWAETRSHFLGGDQALLHARAAERFARS